MKWLFFICVLSGCTLFQKSESDELVALTDDVLKHKEGVNIRIEPIQGAGLK